MNREDWLHQQIEIIKAGGAMRMTCVMATPDRLELGLCSGSVPLERMRRGSDTCSPECQADKKRLMRWMAAQKACRLCGRALPKKKQQGIVRREHNGEGE